VAPGRLPTGTLLASRPVYLSPEDSRSDVILAGATTLFGGFAVGVLARLPIYPRSGLLPLLLGVVWVFVLTGLVPLLLARYRGDGIAAFGLDAPRAAWTAGIALAVPVVALGVLRQLVVSGTPTGALLGRIGGASFASPVIGDGGSGFGIATILQVAIFVVTTVGALLLVTFLTVRGREAFRSPDVSLTELIRTFGMGAAGVALILGLLRSIGSARLLPVVLHVVTLAAVVLLADRLVPTGATTRRAAILTPVVFMVVSHVFAYGGLFRGDLIAGLYTGALAAGTAAVVAVVVESRSRAWAIAPLIVALHWWPSCLSPLAIELGAAAC
jgi:hypothetical protein